MNLGNYTVPELKQEARDQGQQKTSIQNFRDISERICYEGSEKLRAR